MLNDSLQLLLIDCGSRKFPELGSIVENCGCEWRPVLLNDSGAIPDQPGDALILSGGPHLFTDPAQATDLRRAFAFLDRETRPVLGICLGFQALALAAGGEIFRGPARRGRDRIRLTGPHPLTAGLDEETEFREDHTEGVRLPPGMLCLGCSEHYPAEIAADDARRRYGVQFHPEVSGEAGVRLIRNFLQIVSPCRAGGAQQCRDQWIACVFNHPETNP